MPDMDVTVVVDSKIRKVTVSRGETVEIAIQKAGARLPLPQNTVVYVNGQKIRDLKTVLFPNDAIEIKKASVVVLPQAAGSK